MISPTSTSAARSEMTRAIVVRELRKQIPALMALGALIVLTAAVNIITPLLFKALVDSAIPAKDLGQVLWLLVGMVSASLLGIVLSALQNYQRAKVGEAVSQGLRQRLFDHTIRVRLSALEKLKVGEIVHRIKLSCGEVGSVYVSDQLLPALSNVVILAGSAVAMAVLNWRLALVVLLASPLSYLLIRRIRAFVLRLNVELFRIIENGSGYLHEAFSGIRTIRAFNGEEHEREHWAERNV